MDWSRLQTALRGVAITTITSFTTDLEKVDVDGIRHNLDYLVREGAGLVVPCGNTGEFYSLTEHEWLEVVRTTSEVSRGRMTILAGVGNSVKTAIDQVHQAENAGAEGVMVMYPQHVFMSEEGLLAYYREVLSSAKSVGVVLYKKGPLLSDDILLKLIEYDNLVAVKYAFGRVVDFARTVQRIGTSIVWSCGTAERFAPFYWLSGAEGFTSGLGNFAPKISIRMYNALRAGDMTEAMRLQEMVTGLEDLREGRGAANNVPIVKAAMDRVGLVGRDCRPPIHKLTTAEREATDAAIAEWGLW